MIEINIPDMNGKPMAYENSHPPKGGPAILPSESIDDNNPVVLPYPYGDVFVSKEETLGRMTPFPIPKMDKKIVAVKKSLINKIKPNPIADIMIPI